MPKQISGTLRGDADGGWENGCGDRSAHVRPAPDDGAGWLGHGAGRRCRCRHTARDRRAARSGGDRPPPLRLHGQAAHRGLQAGRPARHGAGCGPGRRQGVRRRPAAVRQSGHLEPAGDDAQRDRAALCRPGPPARLRLQPSRGGPRLPGRPGGRSVLRHVLLGRGLCAGPQHQLPDGAGRGGACVRRHRQGTGLGRLGQPQGAGADPGPGQALCAGPGGRPQGAGCGLCRCDDGGRKASSATTTMSRSCSRTR